MKSYAKINLSLDVVSKRSDGYHNIASIMQRVDLFDEMFIEKSKSFEFTCDMELPKINTVTKAYDELVKFIGEELPVKIDLRKKIPSGAGLAGGSANAATLLEEVNRIYELGLSTQTLRRIGLGVGADVPFMVSGTTALCEGIGEIITDIKINNGIKALLVNPNFEISSKEIYSVMKLQNNRIDFDKLSEALRTFDLEKISEYLRNDMEFVVFEKYPEVAIIKETMKQFTPAALMSGSGSTVYGLFSDADINEAYDYLKKKYEKTYMVNFIDDLYN